MVPRPRLVEAVQRALARSPAVVLAGPRQSGKTTLARQFLRPESSNYFDLEDPLDAARLAEPMLNLAPLEGLVVIDEVQREPALFPALRVLIDRAPRKGQFLLLGSASPALLARAGESLLGRVEVMEVTGFDLLEVLAGAGNAAESIRRTQDLWLRGGYPPSFLASSDGDSFAWRQNAVARHVEVDMPQLGIGALAPTMLRFWRMLAHYHGQVWNAAEPARSLGASEPTVRRYLDALTQTLMIRQLQPWHENLAKRQVRSPKIYFRDSGLLHALMNLPTMDDLLANPRSGASWEGFAVEQILRIARPDEAYFWATHQGAELDLLLLHGTSRVGVEVKRTDVPAVTRSMRTAITDLGLDALYVVYPGTRRFALAPGIEAVPLGALIPEESGSGGSRR